MQGISVNGEKNAAVIVAHPDDEILWAGGRGILVF
jgi:hypothetical protein